MDTKMQLYKTAYSPLYEHFVEILGTYEDEKHGVMVIACLEGDEVRQPMIFRDYELIEYCL